MTDQKLTAILIDDEIDSLKVLELELKRNCPEVDIKAACQSPFEGLKLINKYKPDLIFLDINMPEISGLELIEMIPSGQFEIIFTTAFEGYAVKAFKTCAVEYLLKPVSKSEILRVIGGAKDRKKLKLNAHLGFLSQQIEDIKNNTLKRIKVPTLDGISFIELMDIMYCESAENYAYIFLSSNDKVFVSKPLKYLEEILIEYGFERVHKSYIINPYHIQKYIKGEGGYLLMKDGKKINISRSKKDQFLKKIENG